MAIVCWNPAGHCGAAERRGGFGHEDAVKAVRLNLKIGRQAGANLAKTPLMDRTINQDGERSMSVTFVIMFIVPATVGIGFFFGYNVGYHSGSTSRDVEIGMRKGEPITSSK